MGLHTMAVDLGASSGRAFIGHFDGEQLQLEEIRSFPNGGLTIGSHLYWNILGLYGEIKNSVKEADRLYPGKIKSIAIDAWGVDYGLLGADDQLLANPIHYRDARTDNLLEEIFTKVSREELYSQTGIQFMAINTLVQLYADQKYRPWVLENAKSLLFIPDLLNFFFTGHKVNEQTIASTSQFYNPHGENWAFDILRGLNLPTHILETITKPGTVLGPILPSIGDRLNLKSQPKIVGVASHDTASAVAATPFSFAEDSLFISCGTWSLLGAEINQPHINAESFRQNFTNECGLEGTITLLRNITGMWLLQQCKAEWERKGRFFSYAELSQAASRSTFSGLIDPNDPSFVNPTSMLRAIQDYCLKKGSVVPESPGDFTRCIYLSLAQSYKEALTGLEAILNRKLSTIHIVGGGSQGELLCQLTADITGLPVLAGPVEATVLGNILGQLIALGEIKNLQEGRELIKRSFKPKEYLPSKII